MDMRVIAVVCGVCTAGAALPSAGQDESRSAGPEAVAKAWAKKLVDLASLPDTSRILESTPNWRERYWEVLKKVEARINVVCKGNPIGEGYGLNCSALDISDSDSLGGPDASFRWREWLGNLLDARTPGALWGWSGALWGRICGLIKELGRFVIYNWLNNLLNKLFDDGRDGGIDPGTDAETEPFRDCEQCPMMVMVPANPFMMGSPASEAFRDKDEGPVRQVTISEPFAVGKYEVTFAEWDACVSDGGCGGHNPEDYGWGRGKRPVIWVSWNDAQSYVGWLRRKTEKEYRLLSESEWEYAARAGTPGPFHTGGTISTDQANYDGDEVYGSGRKGVDRKKTVPVGSFAPNGFGLHDMHGNVWELVEDCWNGSYAGAPADGSAWKSGDCGRRVMRGGAWNNSPRNLRSANRIKSEAGDQAFFRGFRVACDLQKRRGRWSALRPSCAPSGQD